MRLNVAGVAGHTAAITHILDDPAALALAARPDATLSAWKRDAARLAAAGHAPRFRSLAEELQLSELRVAAGAPIVLFPLDPLRSERAAPLIAISQ